MLPKLNDVAFDRLGSYLGSGLNTELPDRLAEGRLSRFMQGLR